MKKSFKKTLAVLSAVTVMSLNLAVIPSDNDTVFAGQQSV